MESSARIEEESVNEDFEEVIPHFELRDSYEDLLINTHNLVCKYKDMKKKLKNVDEKLL